MLDRGRLAWHIWYSSTAPWRSRTLWCACEATVPWDAYDPTVFRSRWARSDARRALRLPVALRRFERNPDFALALLGAGVNEVNAGKGVRSAVGRPALAARVITRFVRDEAVRGHRAAVEGVGSESPSREWPMSQR